MEKLFITRALNTPTSPSATLCGVVALPSSAYLCTFSLGNVVFFKSDITLEAAVLGSVLSILVKDGHVLLEVIQIPTNHTIVSALSGSSNHAYGSLILFPW